jgi:hypothetical protein
MFDNMQEQLKRYPKAVAELRYQIDAHDLEYADNWRVAKRDDSFQRVFYDEAAQGGCCGSFDTVVVIDGEEFLIGCNYGH